MTSNRMHALALAFLACASLAGLTPAATADPSYSILPGYDLFVTDAEASHIGLNQLVLSHFRGVPIGSYDFGGDVGVAPVGATDTIVRRTGASLGAPAAQIELVMLQLQSVENPNLFVTLQSDRGRNALDPQSGNPSTGSLQVLFSPDGRGGTFDSDLDVHFDLRLGSLTGPIVSSHSLHLVTRGTAWVHDDEHVRCLTHPEYLTNQDTLAQHGICKSPTQVDGASRRLNGVDTSQDFVPGDVA